MIDPFALGLLAVDAEEDDTEKDYSNDYVSKKDIRWVLIFLTVMAVLCYPAYKVLKSNADAYQCKENFRAISEAMLTYTDSNDGRMPPAFFPSNDDPNVPALDIHGRPYTWASILQTIAGFDPRRSFKCPSASDEESVAIEGEKGATELSTYGMNLGLAFANRSNIADTSSEIAVAETSNGGVEDTYDPHPITINGKIYDGFLVGYSSGNIPLAPGTKSIPDPSVTRLAFYQSKNGLNENTTRGRHGNFILALFADGHIHPINVLQALNQDSWQVPSP